MKNMFGEMNWICFLIGHKLVLVGDSPYQAVCKRCELYDKTFTLSTGNSEEKK